MAELKCCPFCGMLPKVYKASKARGQREENFFTNQPVFVVWCQYKFCDVQPCTREYIDRRDAVKVWNTRITPIIPDDTPQKEEKNGRMD